MSDTPNPLAGQPAPPDVLIDVEALREAYYSRLPDPSSPEQQVSFGTSGHRGSALDGSFNEWHVLAITQALCDHRKAQGIAGPLFLGADTHALSAPAVSSALEITTGMSISAEAYHLVRLTYYNRCPRNGLHSHSDKIFLRIAALCPYGHIGA